MADVDRPAPLGTTSPAALPSPLPGSCAASPATSPSPAPSDRQRAFALPGRARGPVAHYAAWPLGDGLYADIDLVVTDVPVDDEAGGAAATVVRDAGGSFCVVHSVRRGSWDCPGGRREAGESLRDCAVRELHEETGLHRAPRRLRRVGYERIVVNDSQHWTWERPCVQIFTTTLGAVRPPLVPGGDVDGAQWVDAPSLRRLCSGLFWWPLVEAVFAC